MNEPQARKASLLSQIWKEINATASALYGLLHSMSFAVFLLIVLAVACAAGMIIPQQAPPESYLRAYGSLRGDLILRLGLADVFHASWFYALVLVLAASLVVCSVHRSKLMWRLNYSARVEAPREEIRTMRAHASWTWAASAEEAVCRARQALRAEGYKVLVGGSNNSRRGVLGRKGLIGNWGTLLIHSSFLVVLAGALYGHLPEVRVRGRAVLRGRGVDATIRVLEGEKFRPPGARFQVRLRRLRIPVDDMGRPMQYYSDLEILEDGKVVARPTICVNRTYGRDGYLLYQSQWSLEGFILRVSDSGGRIQDFRIPVREEGYEPLDALLFLRLKPCWILVHAFLPDAVFTDGGPRPRSQFPVSPAARIFVDPRRELKPPFRFRENDVGWVTEQKEGHFRGLSFKILRTIKSSGILVRRDPGLPLVWTGFAMILIGIFLTFYVTPRTVRLIVEQKGSKIEVEAGIDAAGSTRVEGELEKLRQAMEQGAG